MEIRKIVHIDMDAFYASIEQRDNPDLRGKPVIVGSLPDKRGVVATCSYEARGYGIHSAMPSKTAYNLCPTAIFVKPRLDVYEAVSLEIRDIFYEYTDIVEPLSFDEAFLDVTENKKGISSATQIAKEIKEKIYKTTMLTASAGVSFNKSLAKIASDLIKPNGLTVITPKVADIYIDTLPVGKFYGIGKVTEKKLHRRGIRTGRDLKRLSEAELVQMLGAMGVSLYKMLRCEDDRPVISDWERKSLGKEVTFEEDISDRGLMIDILTSLSTTVEQNLKELNLRGRTITLKVKYHDFHTITRSISTSYMVSDADVIMEYIKHLLKNTEAGTKKVRLLGVTVSNFHYKQDWKNEQLSLPFY
ncbi:ImpB/MucB/SamB family protein [Candidatus Magnetobacterium bavaricum]|uniref:DNA polymerase IV n=1 Tax=Candidatus Magnetobacterium bavaricum TaxID=29290 RepID=A0A0F3GRW0_9BACT|nr:ImpB/MucB/SamB family protein [Candidatus Magnetobacterium bavaricum]